MYTEYKIGNLLLYIEMLYGNYLLFKNVNKNLYNSYNHLKVFLQIYDWLCHLATFYDDAKKVVK